MAHNPMIEIVLEKALNALSACDNVLAQELITLEYKEERFKSADQIKERVKQISDLKREVESVLRQGNSLDL
jgi:hypothetical protein